MADEAPRSRAARLAAEQALVRVVHHYDGKPEFVVLGGLVPELLCAGSGYRHIGTTDVDVQIDLEVAAGAVNVARLERALRNAEFEPDAEHVWRWRVDEGDRGAVVKFELLADRRDAPNQSIVNFEECEHLGAVNLRGTGFAARDVEVRRMRARIGGVQYEVDVNVTGLAGFLLAKVAAAQGRRLLKDWYDIAFVLQHNEAGGPRQAAVAVQDRFGADLMGATRTGLADLQANFADEHAQGPQAYAAQMLIEHPELDRIQLRADSVIAVRLFCGQLLA